MMRRRDFVGFGALTALGVVPATTRAGQRTLAAKVVARNAHIVIAGGGFAGASCALNLRRLNPAIQVTLIDADENYVTCPMSNEALVGSRTVSSLTISRAGLRRAGVRCVRARVAGIDALRRRAELEDGRSLAYDRLVVAPGIRFLWGTPEGYDETAAQRMPHAWKAGEQTELLAAQLRAMPDGGTVAISVPAGLMRCPPAPYERASLIAAWLKRHKPRSKVLIFDANNHFPRQDVFNQAWNEFYPGMIEWIPVVQGGAVARVDAKKSTLYTSQGEQRVAVANIIPPQAPGQLALDSGLASGHGWCPIKPLSFESQLIAQIHVIGDACIADAMPKSASAAHSQAVQCAVAIVAMLNGREPPEPAFDSVCYSLVSADLALAIPGKFNVRDNAIRQIQNDEADASIPSSSALGPAQRAEQWYRSILANAFAA